jgi:hypothetical protein
LFFIFGCDVADLTAIRSHVNFNGVILKRKTGIAYVDWYAAEALVQYLVMNSARIDGYSRTTFRMRIHSKNESWNVTEDDPTKGVGQRHVDSVDGEVQLTSFVGF